MAENHNFGVSYHVAKISWILMKSPGFFTLMFWILTKRSWQVCYLIVKSLTAFGNFAQSLVLPSRAYLTGITDTKKTIASQTTQNPNWRLSQSKSVPLETSNPLSMNIWMPRTNVNLVRTLKIPQAWRDKTRPWFDVRLCFTDKSVGWMHKTGKETPNKCERQRRSTNNSWSSAIQNNQALRRCQCWTEWQNINKPCEQHVN